MVATRRRQRQKSPPRCRACQKRNVLQKPKRAYASKGFFHAFWRKALCRVFGLGRQRLQTRTDLLQRQPLPVIGGRCAGRNACAPQLCAKRRSFIRIGKRSCDKAQFNAFASILHANQRFITRHQRAVFFHERDPARADIAHAGARAKINPELRARGQSHRACRTGKLRLGRDSCFCFCNDRRLCFLRDRRGHVAKALLQLGKALFRLGALCIGQSVFIAHGGQLLVENGGKVGARGLFLDQVFHFIGKLRETVRALLRDRKGDEHRQRNHGAARPEKRLANIAPQFLEAVKQADGRDFVFGRLCLFLLFHGACPAYFERINTRFCKYGLKRGATHHFDGV